MRAKAGALLLALLCLLQAQAAEPPLLAYASTSWGPPFLLPQRQAGDPPRGLIPDWYAALERALGRPIRLVFLPPRRLSQQSALGAQDFRCFGSAGWSPTGAAPHYRDLAQPFVEVEEVLVGADTAVRALDDLAGKRIGTVADYRYPLLEDGFRSGRLLREDAPDELALLRKQRQSRTDYAVIRLWTLRHLQRSEPGWDGLQVSPLRVSRTGLFCGVRDGGRLSLQALEAAQRKLLRSGELARLLAAHGLL